LGRIELFVVCGHDMQPGGWRSSVLPGERTVDYDGLLRRHLPLPCWAEVPEAAPMGLCYTSGTTGDPKGVMYSHRSTYLTCMSLAMTTHAAVSPVDVILCVVPMFHGLGWALPYVALMLGTKLCFCGARSTPNDQLEMCLEEGVTVSAGVPTVWQQIRQMLEQAPDKYRGRLRLERLIVGGSAPSMALMRWYLEEFGIEMMHSWGMTETNPIGTLSKRQTKKKHQAWEVERQLGNLQNSGLAIPLMEMKIVDPEDFSRELPHDGVAVGELLVRGANVTGEYWRSPASADKFHEGWLATGDIARITPDEEIVITDRSKDLIKSGGEWISSKDVEGRIMGVPGVAAACVVGVPHPKWDERPIAIVERVRGADSVTAEAVLDQCRRSLAKHEVPDEVLFWPSIPLTSTGKLDKKLIRKQLSESGYTLPSLRDRSRL